MKACPIIVITTPGSRRHRLLAEHLGPMGRTVSVCPAVFVEGEPASVAEYDHDRRVRLLGYGLTKGEIGCFLAHRAAWRATVAAGEPCLILEDDARLRPELAGLLPAMADAIAGTKVVLRLFSQRHPPAKVWRTLPDGHAIVRPASPGHSAVATLLDPAAARALLAGSFWQTADDHLDDEAAHGCVVMHVRPELVWHDDEGRSVIGPRDKPALGPGEKLAREWRRLLRRLRRWWDRERTLWRLGLRFRRKEKP